jgi:hypothetical protein
MRERRHALSAFITALSVLFLTADSLSAHCGCSRVCNCPHSPRLERHYTQGHWFVVETQNFRICCIESEQRAENLARHAETLRTELTEKWFGEMPASSFRPKCQIVLHSSKASYVAAVGRGSEQTVGSSAVKVSKGRITNRRIDLLGGRTEFLTAALPHELTHIVLIEHLPSLQIPRWADEGMAMLADTAAKQNRHRKDLRDAIVRQTTFNAALLVTMEEYPPVDRWGAYYGQSISLTEFLVQRKSPRDFIEFIERATIEGYDAALVDCYGITDMAELDRLWHREVAETLATL